jgi:predicted nicotinamide N-methyase
MNLHSEWDKILFDEQTSSELGQRLGISYMRTLQEEVVVSVNKNEIKIAQSSMGLMAISNVVWDCGLYLVDVLVYQYSSKHGDTSSITSSQVLGRTLELGCGTGVAGIAALLLGSERVLFSDINSAHCLNDNLEQLDTTLVAKTSYLSHDWNEQLVPSEFTDSTWDTLLCSDVLYEEKNHSALLGLLRKLRFRRMFLAYKRRHDEPERVFFESLSQWCAIRVVDPLSIPLRNIGQSALGGLFVVLVEPLEAV